MALSGDGISLARRLDIILAELLNEPEDSSDSLGSRRASRRDFPAVLAHVAVIERRYWRRLCWTGFIGCKPWFGLTVWAGLLSAGNFR